MIWDIFSNEWSPLKRQESNGETDLTYGLFMPVCFWSVFFISQLGKIDKF